MRLERHLPLALEVNDVEQVGQRCGRGKRFVIHNKARSLIGDPAGNFFALIVNVAAEVSLAHVGLVSVRDNAPKIFVNAAPDNRLVNQQEIRLGKEIVAAVNLRNALRKIFMCTVEIVEVIGVKGGQNFVERYARCTVRQNAQCSVDSVRRIKNVFVAVKRGKVLPIQRVDTFSQSFGRRRVNGRQRFFRRARKTRQAHHANQRHKKFFHGNHSSR